MDMYMNMYMYIHIYIYIYIYTGVPAALAACRDAAMYEPEGTERATSVKRATSSPAEGPAYGLDFARYCEFSLRTLQAQKCHIYFCRGPSGVGLASLRVRQTKNARSCCMPPFRILCRTPSWGSRSDKGGYSKSVYSESVRTVNFENDWFVLTQNDGYEAHLPGTRHPGVCRHGCARHGYAACSCHILPFQPVL